MMLEPPAADNDSEPIDEFDQSDVSRSRDLIAPKRAAKSSRRRDYAREDERRRQRRADARTQRTGGEVDTAAVHGNGNGSGRVVNGWPEPLAALIDAGAVVEEVRLRMDVAIWSLVLSKSELARR